MFDAITIGGATLDSIVLLKEAQLICKHKKKNCVLCFNFGEKIPINGMLQTVGGNAGNVAIGLNTLGLNSTIYTFVGDDLIADVITSELKKHKLPTGLVHVQKNASSNYAIILNYRGERTILSYHGVFKYQLGTLPKTKWIYYSSLGKGFEKLQRQLIKHLKKNKRIKLAVNPGSYQLKDGIKAIRQILPFADVLFVNVQEAQRLLNKRVSIKSCAKGLYTKGVKLVVITDGADGSYLYDGKQLLHQQIFPIEAIGKTGAGDAYSSGFLSALINKKTPEEAMRWGTANAGGVIQKFGAHNGLLNKSKLQRMLRSYKKYIPKKI